MIVDAHQHFWDPARGDYGWLKPGNPIHRVYDAADLQPLLLQTGVDATVLVQAAPTPEETDYMLGIARDAPWVLGVVGWIDLAATDASDEVRRRAFDPLFLGVRPMLQDITDPEWILNSALTPALNAIAAEGLVFDALVLSHQITVITELATRHPSLPSCWIMPPSRSWAPSMPWVHGRATWKVWRRCPMSPAKSVGF
jgi:L-fuconolactonase